jgi:membrane glycosyltransferase
MQRTNIIGIYDDPDVVVAAAKKLKEKEIRIKNVFSPFPLHELWDVLGLKTRLPLLAFIYGTLGLISIYAFLYWTSVVNYPLKFGGKPLNSLSFIIIVFVGTIFVGVLLTFMTFFIRQKIGPGKKVVMIDPRTTDDKFAIVIEKNDGFTDEDVKRITSILWETGAVEVSEKVQPDHYIEEEND